MVTATSAYGPLLRRPHVLSLLGTNLFGRLPNGMASLALTLLLRSEDATFGRTGVMVACFALAFAAGGPVLGRLVDKRGQSMVLLASTAVSGAAFATLAMMDHPSVWQTVLLIVVAGAFTPPLEPCLRSVWNAILPTRLQSTAFSLDAALQEVVFVLGPLLTVGVAGTAGSPRWAVGATAAFAITGTVAFAVLRPVRTWRPPHRDVDWLGPLRAAPLPAVYLSFGLVGTAVGVLSVAAVGYAEHAGNSQLSGVLLGLNAAGALLGGLVYGRITVGHPPARQLPWLLTGLAACYLPLATSPEVPAMAALMAIAGVLLAPSLACCFLVIGQTAPPGTQTEAFAWVITVFVSGTAAGSAAAGASLSIHGLHVTFLLSGAAGILAAAVAHAGLCLGERAGTGPRV